MNCRSSTNSVKYPAQPVASRHSASLAVGMSASNRSPTRPERNREFWALRDDLTDEKGPALFALIISGADAPSKSWPNCNLSANQIEWVVTNTITQEC